MTTKVVIIGAGEIGKAIAHVLAKKSNLEITLWSRSGPQTLTQVVPGAEIIFLCVPSWAVAEILDAITPHLNPSSILVSLAKGMGEKTMDQLLRPPFALLAGPTLAEELLSGKVGSAVVATAETDTFTAIAALFSNTAISVVHSTAIHQVALASVLKNVYALGLAMAMSDKSGDNFRGQYISSAAGEMAQVCGQEAYGLAGLGDLIATAISPYSANRQAGTQILAGHRPSKPSEGLHSLPYVVKLFTPLPPLLRSLYDRRPKT